MKKNNDTIKRTKIKIHKRKDGTRYIKFNKKMYELANPDISNKAFKQIVINNIIKNNSAPIEVRKRRKRRTTSNPKTLTNLKSTGVPPPVGHQGVPIPAILSHLDKPQKPQLKIEDVSDVVKKEIKALPPPLPSRDIEQEQIEGAIQKAIEYGKEQQQQLLLEYNKQPEENSKNIDSLTKQLSKLTDNINALSKIQRETKETLQTKADFIIKDNQNLTKENTTLQNKQIEDLLNRIDAKLNVKGIKKIAEMAGMTYKQKTKRSVYFKKLLDDGKINENQLNQIANNTSGNILNIIGKPLFQPDEITSSVEISPPSPPEAPPPPPALPPRPPDNTPYPSPARKDLLKEIATGEFNLRKLNQTDREKYKPDDNTLFGVLSNAFKSRRADIEGNDDNDETETEWSDDDVQEGSGKKKTYDEGLFTNEINDLMRAFSYENGYVGTAPYDMLHLLPPMKQFSCIINTDKSGKKGEHWIALYYDEVGSKSVEIYDPLAEAIDDEILDKVKQLVKKFKPSHMLKYKYNLKRDQDTSSNNCGWFCILFLVKRYAGKSFSQASNLSEKDVNHYKTILKEYPLI